MVVPRLRHIEEKIRILIENQIEPSAEKMADIMQLQLPIYRYYSHRKEVCPIEKSATRLIGSCCEANYFRRMNHCPLPLLAVEK